MKFFWVFLFLVINSQICLAFDQRDAAAVEERRRNCLNSGGVWDSSYWDCRMPEGGETPRRVDPVDDAIGNMMIELFRAYANSQKPTLPPSQPQTERPREQDETDAALVFSGVARNQSGRKQWPFELSIDKIRSSSGVFLGRIYWPTLRSLHRIEGTYASDKAYFREISALRRGGAVLGCEYWLTTDRNSVSEGEYECYNGAGWVRMRLKVE